MEVLLDSLRLLPHFGGSELKGRDIPLLPLFNDNSEWQFWMPHNRILQPLQAFPCEGAYFSHRPAKSDDLRSTFIELMFQRALWKDIFPLVHGVLSDINNLGASLEKLDLIFANITKIGFGACRMAATELEYIFSVCRTVFDLLQETISALWKRAHFADKSMVKRRLPDSFQRMVFSGNAAVPPEDIARKWSLPMEIAQTYHRCNPFFAWLRTYRSHIEHGGKSFDLIFPTDEGFAVPLDEAPFAQMNVWKRENINRQRQGSLRTAAAHIVKTTLHALEEFSYQLRQTVGFPDEFAPGYHVYLCGQFIGRVTNIDNQIVGSPWLDSQHLDLVPPELRNGA